MKKDKSFIKATQKELPVKELMRRSVRRKQTITDHEYDENFSSVDSPIGHNRQYHHQHSSMIDPRNFKLDKRINPQKDIVLDISIINKPKQSMKFPKSVKYTSKKMYPGHVTVILKF